MSPVETASAVFNRLGSSVPLLKQIVINARECLTNPAAFPDIKGSIDSYLPYSIFGSTPNVRQNSTCKEEKQPAHEDESRGHVKATPVKEEPAELMNKTNAKPCEKLSKSGKEISRSKKEVKKRIGQIFGEAAQGNDKEGEEDEEEAE
ncbi:hypothetical protein KIN20_034146 [Parelaphostrongylus tenuis]|uniref:Uncharacterized protein n=1 Tax=Parelaphostrongylus tenuis TaxID=148309 RepID=A0AAD5R9X6_PARTN|nr:hypothetical protein KIN20_034146 [Parelaphostrongylus tenuis]